MSGGLEDGKVAWVGVGCQGVREEESAVAVETDLVEGRGSGQGGENMADEPETNPFPVPPPMPEAPPVMPYVPPVDPYVPPAVSAMDFEEPVGGLRAEERTMGMLCHLLAFSGYLIPFGHLIGPLVMWLVKKDESAFVDANGKESLNFQITLTIAGVVSGILCLVLIGFLLLPVVIVGGIVLTIIASIKANEGTVYRYPVCLRLIH